MNKKLYICNDIRCLKCRKKLAESRVKKKQYDVEIKCPKCGYINKI